MCFIQYEAVSKLFRKLHMQCTFMIYTMCVMAENDFVKIPEKCHFITVFISCMMLFAVFLDTYLQITFYEVLLIGET